MKILPTGGAGFFGDHAFEALRAVGFSPPSCTSLPTAPRRVLHFAGDKNVGESVAR